MTRKLTITLTEKEASALFTAADNTLLDGAEIYGGERSREGRAQHRAALRAMDKLQRARHRTQNVQYEP